MSNEMSEERRCTCNHHIPRPQAASTNAPLNSLKEKSEEIRSKNEGHRVMDDYIHLNLPMNTTTEFINTLHDSPTSSPNEYQHAGFLDSLEHTSTLVQLGEGKFTEWKTPLCRQCFDRVCIAIEENIERLQNECQAYVDVVNSEEDQLSRMKRDNSNNTTAIDPGCKDISATTTAILAYHSEIDSLKSECHTLQQELTNINQAIQKEQIRSEQLNQAEERLFTDFNSLEITSQTNQNYLKKLASDYRITKEEMELISKVKIHSLFFDMGEDGGGGNKGSGGYHYEMINGLRLGHRPNGNLAWIEINAAWALAAQLLMFVGGMLKFSTKKFQIEPLTSSCAKIIEISIPDKKKKIHYLGKEENFDLPYDNDTNSKKANEDEKNAVEHMVKSLCAFHCILHLLLSHAQLYYEKIVKDTGRSMPPTSLGPFPMDSCRIGVHDISKLESTDDAGWLAVIHCMSENMKWLLECASFCAKNTK